jgi:hypothetical protein
MRRNRGRLERLEKVAELVHCPKCGHAFAHAGSGSTDSSAVGVGLLEEMAPELRALRNWRPPQTEGDASTTPAIPPLGNPQG